MRAAGRQLCDVVLRVTVYKLPSSSSSSSPPLHSAQTPQSPHALTERRKGLLLLLPLRKPSPNESTGLLPPSPYWGWLAACGKCIRIESLIFVCVKNHKE